MGLLFNIPLRGMFYYIYPSIFANVIMRYQFQNRNPKQRKKGFAECLQTLLKIKDNYSAVI